MSDYKENIIFVLFTISEDKKIEIMAKGSNVHLKNTFRHQSNTYETFCRCNGLEWYKKDMSVSRVIHCALIENCQIFAIIPSITSYACNKCWVSSFCEIVSYNKMIEGIDLANNANFSGLRWNDGQLCWHEWKNGETRQFGNIEVTPVEFTAVKVVDESALFGPVLHETKFDGTIKMNGVVIGQASNIELLSEEESDKLLKDTVTIDPKKLNLSSYHVSMTATCFALGNLKEGEYCKKCHGKLEDLLLLDSTVKYCPKCEK